MMDSFYSKLANALIGASSKLSRPLLTPVEGLILFVLPLNYIQVGFNYNAVAI